MNLIQTRGSRHWRENISSKAIHTDNVPTSVVNKYYMSSSWGGGDLDDPNIGQYLNTDYYIVCGGTGKARLTVNNNTLKYYNTSVAGETNHLIPLGGYRKVRNVKLKYKMVNTLSGGNRCFLHIGLQRYSNSGTFEGWRDIVIDDSHATTNEISVNVNCNFVADYIRFNTYIGELYVKDIQIAYEE